MPEVLVKGCVAKGSKLLSSGEVVILSKTSKSRVCCERSGYEPSCLRVRR